MRGTCSISSEPYFQYDSPCTAFSLKRKTLQREHRISTLGYLLLIPYLPLMLYLHPDCCFCLNKIGRVLT